MSSENSTTNGSANCLGWATRDSFGVLSPYKFNRRDVQDDDVSIKITHCGVCYAEVVWPRNKHGDATYPIVLGHEIAGIVQEVGPNVRRFKVGDHVGVGTYTNSCTDRCTASKYQKSIHWLQQHHCFVLALLFTLPCMMDHKMNKPGKSLGVIGLGSLGHMAVKFGKAFGLKVTVFSTGMSKKDEALTLLGADNFVALAKSLDFIIDTASGNHPIELYMSLLKTAGVLVLVGVPSEIKLKPFNLITGKRSITGSVAGGTKQIQEMVHFCAAHKIYPNIEVVPIQM
ncbi:putative 8-hydroxygeraniol dehydrogenase [Rosa chinensis]|uniref:Putative 8-hydroxygeraniol dehydrogenase n=1 Tax=Rosa chinensis TaxID=74649 RepID=A0A2P6S187_ROSCH|nr:putative 8-hydroxygeraniol dehydrogenase [Rosa chinensis]